MNEGLYFIGYGAGIIIHGPLLSNGTIAPINADDLVASTVVEVYEKGGKSVIQQLVDAAEKLINASNSVYALAEGKITRLK